MLCLILILPPLPLYFPPIGAGQPSWQTDSQAGAQGNTLLCYSVATIVGLSPVCVVWGNVALPSLHDQYCVYKWCRDFII